MNLIKCVYCGSELKPMLGVHKEYLKDRILAINNVPLVLCPKCMEEYIPANTMDVINRIVLCFSDEVDLENENTTIIVNYNDFIQKDLVVEL